MKLVALDVTNLTDARYFAAIGASYIGFDVSNIDITTINAIIPWLNVHGFMLQYSMEVELENIWEHTHKTGINRVIINAENKHLQENKMEWDWCVMLNNTMDLPAYKGVNCCQFSLESFKKNTEQAFQHISEMNSLDVYIEVGPAFHPEPKLLEKTGVKGIFVRGGKEEKTGLKSFEELDETLEHYADIISYE